jgi:hypothetical protein
LLHAQRVTAVPVAAAAVEPDEGSPGVIAGEPGQAAQVLDTGERCSQRGAFHQRAHCAKVGPWLIDWAPKDERSTGNRTYQSEEHPDGGGLARPVRSDEARCNSGWDLDAELADDNTVAESVRQAPVLIACEGSVAARLTA